MIYQEIYDFCKIRNDGNFFKNELTPTNRVNHLINILNKQNIPYELDSHHLDVGIAHNLILRGSSDKMVVAHHDVSNHLIDNANDNSASIINAIAIKKIIPEINVVLLDGEEVGGVGSKIISEQINNNLFGDIKWVLNLELTGKGGKNFFIGDYNGELSNYIIEKFDCPIYKTAFNDCDIFQKNGIDTTVINPLPALKNGKSSLIHNNKYLNTNILYNCHNEKDSIDSISVNDMKEFVEEVLVKILEK